MKKCQLLDESESNRIIDLTPSSTKLSSEEIENLLDSALSELKITTSDFSKLKSLKTKENYFLLINHESFDLISQNPNSELMLKFLKVGILSKAVIGFRLTPITKTKIAELVKQYSHLKTCAFGMSRRDLPMMMSSHLPICVGEPDESLITESVEFKISSLEKLK